jgi:hypothetical protein
MSNITFTYGGATIAPAPKINIKSNIIYANDSAIGYEHEVTLNGQAIDKDVLTFGATISKAEEIRQTLSKNGSVLIVSGDGSDLIKAFGGVLTDLKFDSDNSFSKFANYSATIIFNELNILDDSFSCNSSQLSGYSQLIDINKYKIKEFTDSWTFNLDDGIYDFDNQINNSQLSVSYQILAKGLSYFTEDSNIVLPWQQAKNFVQDKLFTQIKNFHNKNILKLDADTACAASKSLTDLHSDNGQLYAINLSYYVYDETISCETSEAEGTFSATYNAILKFDDDNSDISSKEAIHNFTKKISTNYEGSKEIISLSVDGTIKGLNSSNLSTDLVFGGFSLPKNGKLLKDGNSFTKLTNANIAKNKIINASQEDFTDTFKDILNIEDIFSTLNCSDTIISPNVFSLTTDLFLGIINYSAQYSSDRLLAVDSGNIVIYNTTIDVEKPKPIYAELPIVNGNYVIQDLSTTTSQKINIGVNGRLKYDQCTAQPSLQKIKGIMEEFTFPTGLNFILTNKNLLYNFPNHSFTMNVSYLCKSGCPI